MDERKPIIKRKSYAGPNLAESGYDRDRVSSSYYYAWFSGHFFQ